MPQLSLGIDVGGTFTAFAILDPETETFSVGKSLTTAKNPSTGVVPGSLQVFGRLGFSAKEVAQVIQGTTMVANFLLERSGAKVGLITTKGFRDSLEMGTEQRYDMYDLSARPAEPLVPRYLRHGISERVSWEGEVLRPLDLEEVGSKNCQVVVATCDDTRYSGITGHTIRVPLDGKPSLI